MRKFINIVTLVTCSLFAVACNAVPNNEIRTCTYNLEKNEKVCNMTSSERERTLKATVKAADNIKIVDGKSYREQQDGTLVPAQ